MGNNWVNDIDNILKFLKLINFISYKNIDYNKNFIRAKEIKQINNKFINYIIVNKFLLRESISSYNTQTFLNILNPNNENK